MGTSNFCPFCGSPVVQGQNFCSACGKAVPQYQQPQYQQAQYQQPQYQQPQYQPYGQPTGNGKINNLWALITGASVAFLGLVTIVLALALNFWSIILNVTPITLTFFMGLGVTFLIYAYRPIDFKAAGSKKIFHLIMLCTMASFWLFAFLAIAVKAEATAVLGVFAILCSVASITFAVLTFLNDFKKPGLGLIGVCIGVFTLFFWFIMLVLSLGSIGSVTFIRVLYIFTALLLSASAVLIALDLIKKPNVKLF